MHITVQYILYVNLGNWIYKDVSQEIGVKAQNPLHHQFCVLVEWKIKAGYLSWSY